MTSLIASSACKAVIGTGITGFSVARYLQAQGQLFVLLDTRENPPNLEKVKAEFPDISIELGPLNKDTLLSCDEIIVSPGISIETPEIAAAKAAGISVVGDVELFVRAAKAPIVAITGSNAKSTVTTLVGEMAKAANVKVAVGGNLGTPALELLDDSIELYVMELSSFQLETISRLNAKAATILNISADHLDRYENMRAYILAKLRVFFGAENLILNRNDVLTHPPLASGAKTLFFGGKADFGGFGILDVDGEDWLAHNLKPLMPTKEIYIRGRHNVDNALAALALGFAAGLPMEAMLQALRTFKGLRHRCEFVASVNGVEYYNDSKGTNIGATLAAIAGLARSPSKLIVILGGEGKGQDFTELNPVLEKTDCVVVLIGRDAPAISSALTATIQQHSAENFQQSVELAAHLASAGDAVLLSPACASFDMFKNYEDRGEQFCQLVQALADKNAARGDQA